MHAEELVFAKKLDRGERVRAIRGEYFESLEAVRKILTDARLTLWRTIRDKKPDSISGLSQMVGRNFSDVHQDVSILVETGLVDLKKPKGARTRAIKPVSLVDQLEFKVA
jgi:predicted transcriptional regulator